MKSTFTKLLLVIVILVVLALHTSCYSSESYGPTEGIWYCEELQMQLSYDRSYESYVVEEGERLVCSASNPRGVKRLTVHSQHTVHPNHPLMETILAAEIIGLDDNKFTVQEDNSGKRYVFHRTDVTEQTADEYLISEFYYELEETHLYIEYPQLVEDSAYQRRNTVYTAANNLIKSEAIKRTKAAVSQRKENTAVRVGYITTRNQNGIVSFLFQGGIYNTDKEIQEYFAFCITLSVEDGCLVDPLKTLRLDASFAVRLRETILDQPRNYRFTDREWEETMGQISNLTDEELFAYLSDDNQGYLAMGRDEIFVVIHVPHLGKYILVELASE